MFGIGFFEMATIIVVAIIFLGPEKLPQAIVDFTKFIRNIKETIDDAKDNINREIDIQEVKSQTLQYTQSIGDYLNDEIKADEEYKEIKEKEKLNSQLNSQKTSSLGEGNGNGLSDDNKDSKSKDGKDNEKAMNAKADKNANKDNQAMTDKLHNEIQKIKSKIPKWFRNPKQINSKILMGFLCLQEQQSSKGISHLDLKHLCANIKTFESNFMQMQMISPKNHAKVFDYDKENQMIYLWNEVEDFIISEYKKAKDNLPNA